MINTEDQRDIELARKYQIRLGTMKHNIFTLFEQGYSPSEVVYICRDMYVDKQDRRTVSGTIRRYYVDWKNKNP